jgi:hypothetical protein
MSKKKQKSPPKWTDVYPQGTQIGDEESRFFRVLARNPKYKWRSLASLAKEANLTKERAEEIILKYFHDGKNPKGMIFQSPTNEDHWGYWERVPEMMPLANVSISQADKDERIDKSLSLWNFDDELDKFKKMYAGKSFKMNSIHVAYPHDADYLAIKACLNASNEDFTVEVKDEEHIVWVNEFSIDSPEC